MRLIVLFDTTVLIDILRNQPGRLIQIEAMVQAGHLFVTSAINVAEVHAGTRRGEEARTDHVLSGLEVYPITLRIARLGGDLKRTWSRKGQTLKLQDALVAATAIKHGLPLMTSNRKDFPMAELRFYDVA